MKGNGKNRKHTPVDPEKNNKPTITPCCALGSEFGGGKFDILSKAINDAIWDWNVSEGTLEWNHGLFTLYGHDPVATPHNIEDWKNNIHPEDREDILSGMKETFQKQAPNWNGIYRYRCFNGTYKFTYDRAYVVYKDGQPVRMIGAMQDIDERMTSLREIEKLSLVASNTENLVIITDAEENIEWVNQGFVKRTGYTLAEVIGKTPRFLQGPQTDRKALDRIKASLKKQESVTEELLNYARNGSKFWIKLNINPVFDATRKLVKFVAVETDITLLKEYERKITSTARDLTNLIATAHAPIFGLDREGRINEWNNHAMELTGYSKKEVVGAAFLDTMVEDKLRQPVKKKLAEVYSGKPFSNLEVPVITKEKKPITLLLNATPRKNANEEIESLFLVGQDITEITRYRQSLEDIVKERTEELQAALEKEKELANIKSRFASIVSHEFRTPLSTISVSASHIRKYKARLQPEDIDKKLQTIEEQVSHMTRLLEDVLTIGKHDSDKILITRKKINIEGLMRSIVQDVENQFQNSHSIVSAIDVPENEIVSDEGLLRNIFVNLLSNAIKFSPDKKQIFLQVDRLDNTYRFSVRDEGIGIPEADQERIFSPFDRATNASTIPGTGLGLSIVKKATDLIGGSISVSSMPGKGSLFVVLIPVEQHG